jgi:primosomal protein N' (replication factor Y)
MTGVSEFARVAIPLGVHDTFIYSIPEAMRDDVRLGSRVEVPFGTRRTTAFVVELVDRPDPMPKGMKAIHAALDDEEPALLPEILELCRWAAEYYIAPLGEMLRVALPANMAVRGKREAVFTGDDAMIEKTRDALSEADIALLAEIRKRPMATATIVEEFRGGRSSLERLRGAGLISVRDRLTDAAGVRFDRFAILESDPAGLTAKQQAVVELLQTRGGEALVRSLEHAGGTPAVLSALIKKSVLKIERRPRRHTLDAFLAGLETSDAGDILHSDEQRVAVDAVRAALGTFAPFLLQGVTGSGKTEVYIELMREVVKRGGQALLLVPEISLTPVFASRLKERFGDRIAILHSNLSASERFDQWWRARRGEVDVAIGPRSALFTPFQQLGIIVVDEEGDSAYKQEETPRYNARDLAVVRASLRNIPIVLGSATPSLESRENAARGKYAILRMTRRVEARPLPAVEIIDLRREKAEKEDKGFVIFSDPLHQALRATFDAGEQAIILMNRRGYAPYLLCRECGHEYRCRDCSVTLTVHRRIGQLICHYCGYRQRIPQTCGVCGGEVLQPIGFGTEKVEERFRRDFPEVAVDVLDRDSTRRKGSLVAILDRFRRGQSRALIGTQMLSKGHHFPNVTLTGVLNADSILGYPDFRSAEKTFYLLTQVAGRSGRGHLPGRVLIQTAFPSHYAIQHATTHDYESFYRSEIEFRRTFHYPPVTTMIALLFRGEESARVEQAAQQCGTLLEQAITPLGDARLQGPAPAPLARIKGVWRYQILLRSTKRAALRRAVESVMLPRTWKGVTVAIDVDPVNIL